jgi:predicted phage tail protein
MPQFIINGRKGGGGKSGSGGDSGKESANTLRSKATVRLLDMLGEGVIKGLVNGAKSIYLNETPLVSASGDYNFKGVNWDFRAGYPDQSVMPGASGVEAITNVGAEVKYGVPLTRSLTDPDYDATVVTIRIPTLSKSDDKGNINGTTVQFQIDIRYVGGPWSVSSGVVTLTGKCVSPYDKQFYFKLPVNPSGASAPWEIRVTRFTADSGEIKLQNQTYFSSFEGIVEAKFTYPNTAYIGMVIDGEQFNQQIPERKYLIDGVIIRVPTNYTTRLYDVNGNISRNPVYTGVWNGTFKLEWTNNPAWVFYDMIVNDRYGLGNYVDISQVDKWGLYEIAKYCDEYVPNGVGGSEPRMTFNGVISTKREAYDTLASMASCFRGMSYWSSGAIIATQDRPKDPSVLANPANVIDGTFERQSTSLKSRHTVAFAKFLNPDDFYKEDYACYQNEQGIAKYGYRDTKFEAVGCTSRGQAHRMAKWTVLTELFETDSINYQAGLDHAGVRPGDIVAIQDPSQAGVEQSGRCSGDPQEFLNNGHFAKGLTGWTITAPAGTTATVTSGALNLTGNGTATVAADQSFKTVIGQTYILRFGVTNGAGCGVRIGVTQGGTTLHNTSYAATYTEVQFVATATTTWLRLWRSAAGTVIVDYASIKKLASTKSIIQIDEPITYEPGNLYWLYVTLPDGTVAESNVVIDTYGDPVSAITVSPAFAVAPDEQSTWVLSRSDLVPELGRVITIKESEPNKYDIMTLQYEPSKFAAVDVDAQFSLIDTSQIPSGPLGVPTAPLFNEYAYALGQTGTIMGLDWAVTAPKDPRIGQFEWQYQTRDAAGTLNAWQVAGYTYDPIITIQDLPGGTYNFRVRSVGAFGSGVSGWLVSTNVLLLGLQSPPATPDQFRISVLGEQSQFSWRIPNILNVSHVEIRHTPNVATPEWNGSVILVEHATGTGIQLPTMAGTFLIRSVSFVGTYSDGVAMVINTVTAAARNAVVDLIEAPTFSGAKGNSQVVLGDLQLTPFGGAFPGVGVYSFATVVDLGDEYTSRLTASIEVFGLDSRDTIDKWASLSTVDALSTASSDAWNFALEYATTLDSPTAVVTRTSTGTYFDADGILKTAAANAPRYNFNPADLLAAPVLLDEQAKTNYMLWSRDFTNAFWTKQSTTATFAVGTRKSVDGVTNMMEITESSTTNASKALYAANISRVSNIASCFSCVIDPEGRKLFQLFIWDEILSNQVAANFDLTDPNNPTVTFKTALGTATNGQCGVQKLGNGLFRCWVSGTPSPGGAANNTRVGVFPCAVANAQAYAGTVGLLACRLSDYQLETGLTPTSIIPTTTATVTRAAELITSQPTWSEWVPFITRDVNFRAIKFRAKLISYDPAVTPVLRTLNVTVDMPDRIIAGNDLVVPTGGLTVVFDPPFKGLTGLSMASQDMATGDRAAITAKSENGFTIRYYNSVGTAISRTFDYTAVGYGVKR